MQKNEVKIVDESMYSPEIEKSILGCFLVDDDSLKYIKTIDVDDFYLPANKKIYKSIQDLNKNNQEINIISVKESMKNIANEIQLLQYLAELTDLYITSASIQQDINILKNYSTRRKIKKACLKILNDIHDINISTDAVEIKKDCINEFLNIKTGNISEIKDIRSVIAETTEDIEKNYKKRNDNKYKTGFFDLDKVTDGLHEQELTIIAARPGMGKTSLALNIAENISEGGIGTYFVSLEMSERQLGNRLISSKTGIDSHKLRCGWLEDKDFEEISNTAINLSELKLFIDAKSTTIQEIENKALSLKEKNNIGLIIIDYMQLLKSSNKFDIREREVAEISRKLKLLSKDLDIPIIALCQLNRETEKRKRPILADLRESGSIEQDADNVIFLYCDEEKKSKPIIDMEIIIAKQRNGPTGAIRLKYDRKIMKFSNYC